MNEVWSGSSRGVTAGTPTEPKQRGAGGAPPHPPPPWGVLYLSVILPKYAVMTQDPCGGVLGMRNEPDQPPVSFCAPPCAGHNCDTGRRELALPPMPQI